MTTHRIAPDWTPTGDTACTIMARHGTIATVYQPAPRNAPDWSARDERRFQQFVARARANAEDHAGLAPETSTVRWLLSPPPAATVDGRDTGEERKGHDMRFWTAWIILVAAARAAPHLPVWGQALVGLYFLAMLVASYLKLTEWIGHEDAPEDTGRPRWMP